MTHTVFVYGTLLKGLRNHRALAGARFLGTGSAYGVELFDVGPFPAVVKSYKKAVKGELYEVDDITLTRLDILEGTPHLYRRETVTCDLDHDSDAEIEAFIYIWAKDKKNLTPIPSGNYREVACS